MCVNMSECRSSSVNMRLLRREFGAELKSTLLRSAKVDPDGYCLSQQGFEKLPGSLLLELKTRLC